MMNRKQNNGFWFCNIGGLGHMAEYAYRIKHNKGSFIHLLQNGKYLSVPSFPLTPETTSPTRRGATSRSTIQFQSSIREI